jgi:hypothetical protein
MVRGVILQKLYEGSTAFRNSRLTSWSHYTELYDGNKRVELGSKRSQEFFLLQEFLILEIQMNLFLDPSRKAHHHVTSK